MTRISGVRQECPVTRTRATRRWAVSPLDFCVHLLPEGGGLTARCGHLLPTAVHQLDQPPPGAPCEDCRLILLADFALQSAAGALTDALQNRTPDPGRPPVEPYPPYGSRRPAGPIDHDGPATEVGGDR
jgi:hypothetical protein